MAEVDDENPKAHEEKMKGRSCLQTECNEVYSITGNFVTGYSELKLESENERKSFLAFRFSKKKKGKNERR